MIVKIPACYDISFYKEVKDFKAISPRPVLLITKATERETIVDSKLSRFFPTMMEIGCTRGLYHFNRKAVDGARQAEHFIKTISKFDILPTDFLILDVEEGGEKASQLWAWFETVKKAFPKNRYMLYSRKNILDPIIMTQGEKNYFKEIPVWTSGYPYFPDTFSKVPVGYIPDQTKWGKVWLWQYSSHGRVDGITTELGHPTDVDMNWVSPELYSLIGDSILGEAMLVNYDAKVISDIPAKCWATIGGSRIYPDIVKDTVVKVDQDSTVGGVRYFHVVGYGWSKAEWFSYKPADTTPPPPPPPPTNNPTLVHEIKVYSDGKISVDNGTAF